MTDNIGHSGVPPPPRQAGGATYAPHPLNRGQKPRHRVQARDDEATHVCHHSCTLVHATTGHIGHSAVPPPQRRSGGASCTPYYPTGWGQNPRHRAEARNIELAHAHHRQWPQSRRTNHHKKGCQLCPLSTRAKTPGVVHKRDTKSTRRTTTSRNPDASLMIDNHQTGCISPVTYHGF